jgi:hypothetical protein
VQATVGVPNMIADMNSQQLAFTAHDGDLKAGSGIPGSKTITTCADGLYAQGLAYFQLLKAPAVFTPGDNDWTDCDRQPMAASIPANASTSNANFSSAPLFHWDNTVSARKCKLMRSASASTATSPALKIAVGC